MEVNELIKSKVSLAPMAGITDYVLRSLVRKYSKNALLTTEMISSEALTQVKDVVITKRNLQTRNNFINSAEGWKMQSSGILPLSNSFISDSKASPIKL